MIMIIITIIMIIIHMSPVDAFISFTDYHPG